MLLSPKLETCRPIDPRSRKQQVELTVTVLAIMQVSVPKFLLSPVLFPFEVNSVLSKTKVRGTEAKRRTSTNNS